MPLGSFLNFHWICTILTPSLEAAEAEGVNELNRPAILQAFLRTLGHETDQAVEVARWLWWAVQSEASGDVLRRVMDTNLLSVSQEAALLGTMWPASQNYALSIETPQKFIVPRFRRAAAKAPVVLMGERHWRSFIALPETMTIYRGCRTRAADLNPSWTDDRDVAGVFAAGKPGRDEGYVLAAEISRADIIAVWEIFGGSALEIMVDPVGLRDVQVVDKDIPFRGSWHLAVDAYLARKSAIATSRIAPMCVVEPFKVDNP